MIHESSPWKDLLIKDADLIDRWAEKPKATERRSVLIERKVFFSAYAMRKLFEAEKLSTALEGQSVRAERFDQLPSQTLTWWMRHSFHEVFDLTEPNPCNVNVRDLFDTIIHSKIFLECFNSENDVRISGFYVTSDKRDSHLWLIPISDYTKLMRRVGGDYPSTGRVVFHPDTGQHMFWQGHGDIPRHIAAKMDKFASSAPVEAKSKAHAARRETK